MACSFVAAPKGAVFIGRLARTGSTRSGCEDGRSRAVLSPSRSPRRSVSPHRCRPGAAQGRRPTSEPQAAGRRSSHAAQRNAAPRCVRTVRHPPLHLRSIAPSVCAGWVTPEHAEAGMERVSRRPRTSATGVPDGARECLPRRQCRRQASPSMPVGHRIRRRIRAADIRRHRPGSAADWRARGARARVVRQREAVATHVDRAWRSARTADQRSDALIRSSALAPGHSVVASRRFNGVGTVSR